jgi:prepilin-type N-terminal cleavage/methylation domain-containing protein
MAIYNKGFSLVELLVVISIMAILAAITLPNFMGARERARDAQRISDMNAVKNALRMYYNDHQSYPASIDVGMTGYMSSIMNLGYTYTYVQTPGGDGFNLYLGLESGAGDDDLNSQTRCGIGATTDKLYVVCAN